MYDGFIPAQLLIRMEVLSRFHTSYCCQSLHGLLEHRLHEGRLFFFICLYILNKALVITII